jgi:peptidoglycan/xylan/chitin deacetylase (PgdA/CDA1 family)
MSSVWNGLRRKLQSFRRDGRAITSVRASVRNIANSAARATASRIARILRSTVTNKDMLLIFNWHQVSPDFDNLRHHKYTWTSLENFAADVEYLAAIFQIVPLYDAIGQLKSGRLRGRCVALTFDDGDASVAEYVEPFLRQRSLPATFFINTAYLDGRGSYWFPVLWYFCSNNDVRFQSAMTNELRDKALKLRSIEDAQFYNEVREDVERLATLIPDLASRLVSTEWLSGLDGDLFAIGAHGHEHQRFSLMSPGWQRSDLQQNVRILSQFCAYRPIFAVPFGRRWDWNSTTLAIAGDLGLDVVLADGGLNVEPSGYYNRQPADGRIPRDLVMEAIQN